MLKYVAMYGDGWNLTGSPISLPPKLEALERHCESVGRDIGEIEKCLGKKAEKNLLPLQPGDVPDTWADTEALSTDVGYAPSTPIEVGVKNFVEWYLEYYKVNLKRIA